MITVSFGKEMGKINILNTVNENIIAVMSIWI